MAAARRDTDKTDAALVMGLCALALAFVLPIALVAAAVALACLRVGLRARVAVGLLSLALALGALTPDPVARFRAYVRLQQATGFALLDAHLPGRHETVPLVWGDYLRAAAPFSLAGVPLGVLATLGVSLRRRGLRRTPPARDVLDLPDVPVTWAVEGVLGRGVVSMLTCPPGGGKSWWTWALLGAMQDAGTFYGLPVTPPRQRTWRGTSRPMRVLWLTEESASFVPNVERFRIRRGLVHILRRHEVREKTWPDLLQRCRREAIRHRCAYLVIDTIGAWCPEMEQGQAPEMVDLARRVLKGMGLLLSHHDNRQGAVRGYSNLEGAVDILIRLRQVPDRPTARRMVTSRRFGTLDLTAELVDGRYVLGEGETQAVPSAPKAPKVKEHLLPLLGILRGAGPDGHPIKALIPLLGKPKQTVQRQLEELRRLGLADSRGAGVAFAPNIWFITPAGMPVATNPTADPRYLAYLASPAWKRLCQAVLERAELRCEECGCAPPPGDTLEVHHLTRARLYHERLEDLIALCPADHLRYEARARAVT